jgi:hypothetical protein
MRPNRGASVALDLEAATERLVELATRTGDVELVKALTDFLAAVKVMTEGAVTAAVDRLTEEQRLRSAETLGEES